MLEQEKKLIKKVKNGNQQAFKQLYDAYGGYALRTAYAITRNNNHTSDIVQETFIRVYRNINQFDQTKSFKPWFYQILLHESRRYMRKQKQQGVALELEQGLDHFKNEVKFETDDLLERALDKMSEMHRTVLVLKYLNDFTEKEIAQLLNLNINTVKSRLFKARKNLKSILGGEDDEI